MSLTRIALAASVSTMAAVVPAAPAAAYPIDCAILLCLAGGFPASVECSAAKAELLRRITPWPIEPPLQLWRCPMGGGGVSLPSGGGSDSLAPEVAKYRDAIELWSLSKHVTSGSGGRDLYVNVGRYGYAPSGDFVQFRTSEDDVPDWLDEEVRRQTGSTLMNHYGPGFRSIVLRMQDYTGAYSTEWVSY
ncbi:hypothetical protein [Paracoccus benzoatiresistens]